ncbi:pseudouridine synthase [Brunnivagina elsteri]|uniref:Pseudouridine synthase n=1 Tax=Brunnivagina elsteri CCALA 953 TaxID=987040 RepID=A0A2A2TKB3_9CYAN|nr:pseudouridine synthase [Calothrix elsteri]PAX56150.1 pseudouridine synthase [Calothrix elsteri CCALA 953]
MEARLQKVLSQWGVASRRQAEEMIRQSRVRINGTLAHVGQKVDPQRDTITVDGNPIAMSERPASIYLLLNKPVGVVSTCDDPQGRPTVLDLLPQELSSGQGIHPVGRLDVESTGALILTNDGELTYHLTHPRHSISKTYSVFVEGHPPENVLETWRQGVMLDGRKTRRALVRVIKRLGNQTSLEIVLKEGRNRQIRRVADILGYPVIKLHRTAIGEIKLHSPGQAFLKEGSYRSLTDFEISNLHLSISIGSY